MPGASLTEIPKMNIHISDLGPETKVEMPVFGTVYHFPGVVIRTPTSVIAFEEFGAGETVTFSMNEDTAAVVLKGRAEVTYYLAGTSYTEEKRMTLEEGDIYILPTAAFVEWKVDPGSRFRHLCIMMRRSGLP